MALRALLPPAIKGLRVRAALLHVVVEAAGVLAACSILSPPLRPPLKVATFVIQLLEWPAAAPSCQKAKPAGPACALGSNPAPPYGGCGKRPHAPRRPRLRSPLVPHCGLTPRPTRCWTGSSCWSQLYVEAAPHVRCRPAARHLQAQ